MQQPNIIQITDSTSYLADRQLNLNCPVSSRFVLKAKEGQIMNISEINMQTDGHQPYGSLNDKSSIRRVMIGDGPRENHLLLSSSNEIELTVSENTNSFNRFMLKVMGE